MVGRHSGPENEAVVDDQIDALGMELLDQVAGVELGLGCEGREVRAEVRLLRHHGLVQDEARAAPSIPARAHSGPQTTSS